MYHITNRIFAIVLGCVLLSACHGLEELNENPNKVGEDNVDPNLLMSTVVQGAASTVVGLGFGDISGVMQHTQKDGWSSGWNSYDWSNSNHGWGGYYSLLANNKVMIEKAEADELDFHLGVGLVMNAYLFGLIADLYGDAPYTGALRADEGVEMYDPVYDDQKSIYQGVLDDLDRANTLLSLDQGAYFSIEADQDVLYAGNVAKWRKLANSLALRYFMRLSAKEPSMAQAGISKIVSNPARYPLILSTDDDANMDYVGNTSGDSWPTNTVFDAASNGTYYRTKMAKTLVDAMKALDDPRLGVWANRVVQPLVLDAAAVDNYDEVIDGERHVAQNLADMYESTYGFPVDYSKDYIGLPTALTLGSAYNMSKNLDQGTPNDHVSQLNDIYRASSGPLLKARVMSAAEVNFILAEAAFDGWIGGSAEAFYNEAIRQSFLAWGVDGDYGTYIAGPAAYTGYEDIITQKWIASWTAATEAWFDYRRTGLPDLHAGPSAKRQALPLRFYYPRNELDNNTDNTNAAIQKLEPTSFLGDEVSNNSAWSKMWLLQGTGKPY